MQSSTDGIVLNDMTAHLDESVRLAAARLGEPNALEWLFQTYHRPVYALCYRLLSRVDDAEDATQAAFVGAFRSLSKFRGGSSVKTWLFRIAVNESLNLLRQRKRAAGPPARESPAPDETPEIVRRAAIASVLERMRPEQRILLVLFYWEDLSCEEIASVLNISLSAAKMRLKRARGEFQAQYGGEP